MADPAFIQPRQPTGAGVILRDHRAVLYKAMIYNALVARYQRRGRLAIALCIFNGGVLQRQVAHHARFPHIGEQRLP